ncbi:GTP cyclohydrolase 1 [Serratia liquefaciens]|nr:GTP cyclohydrolase 1 [Serratia liquefaciens]
MYVDEIFSGLDYSRFPKITVIENKMKVDEMVTVRDITLTSTCEHHFVTIDGKATVAYIPKDSVIGLSKINRIVQFFAPTSAGPGASDAADPDRAADAARHQQRGGIH